MDSFGSAIQSCRGLPAVRFRGDLSLLRRRAPPKRRDGARVGVLQSVRAAAEPSSVDVVVGKTVDIVKASGDVIKQGIDLVGKGEQAVEKALPVVTNAIEKAAPFAQQVTKSAADISASAITAATPAVKGAIKAASDALTEQGVDVSDVQSKTGTVVRTASDVATPAVKSSINFLTTTDPVLLGYYALGAAGIYFFGPAILSILFGSLRGYAGDISAAGALDAVINQNNAYLLDIRTSSEKERTGVLDVPGNVAGQLIEVELAFTQNRKLRGQMRNPEDVESRITALQIAALRRVSRGSQLFLLDAGGAASKRVAQQLNRLGFGKCFVISGGYSGWMRAKLQTKPSSSVYRPEIVSPARVIGTVLGGTVQRKVSTAPGRKALPPAK